MRNFFSLSIFLSALATTAFASPFVDGTLVLKACDHPRFSKACLVSLMVFRCASYSQDLARTGECLDASRDAAALLDPLAPDAGGLAVYVAFPKELVYLMRRPLVHALLRSIKESLARGYQVNEPFSLWSATLAAMGGDSRKALWFLGVVLQDTTASKIQAVYLERLRDPEIPESVLSTLSDVLDLLEPEQLLERGGRGWLSLYPSLPRGAEREFQSKLYHFYTIAYLAMRLNWLTGAAGRSAFTAFLLEASYKFRAIAPERWPRDPLAFPESEKTSETRDLYTAFLGSQWAVASRAALPSRSEFTRRLCRDPFGFMRGLYLGLVPRTGP